MERAEVMNMNVHARNGSQEKGMGITIRTGAWVTGKTTTTTQRRVIGKRRRNR